MQGDCPHCGYDRTGLPLDAACPECGGRRDAAVAHRSDTFLMRYGKAIIFGSIAAGLLFSGLVIAAMVEDKVVVMLLTLVMSAVPGFGAFVYWWSEWKDERERASGRDA